LATSALMGMGAIYLIVTIRPRRSRSRRFRNLRDSRASG